MISMDKAAARRVLPSESKSDLVLSPDILKGTEARLAALLGEAQQEEKVPLSPLKATYIRRDIVKTLRWFIVADVLGFICGFLLAWALAAVINEAFFARVLPNPFVNNGILHWGPFPLLAMAVVLWFENAGHYRVRMPFWQEITKIVSALAFAMVIDGFLQFAAKEDFSRLWLVSGWGFAALGIVAFRHTCRRLLYRQGLWQVPTLLVGGGTTAEDARAAFKSDPGLGFDIKVRIKDLPRAFMQAGESWESLCAQYEVDYIVIALDGQELAKAELSLAQLMRENVPFSISPPLRHMPVMGMMRHYFFNHEVMLLTRASGLEQPLPRFIKRTFDILVSGTALIVLSPIWLAIAALVVIDGGPVLYGHKRLGLNGRTFSCLKFRSMVVNSDEILKRYLADNPAANDEWQKEWKLRDDPRITRFGAFLRRTSLDELPQLLNVLWGDMSLVGPRPIVVGEVGKYDHDIMHYYRVRPGITGLWQVSGRNDVSYARRVQMDSWYVRNWSLWHDIAILCKTIPVLLKRTGAY